MKKIISFIITALTVVCMLSCGTVSAATSVKAQLSGPKAVHPKEEIEIQLVVNGSNVKGVTGTITYDYSILTYVESEASAKGWNIRVNPVENQLFFSAANASNKNPLNGKAILTFKFSTEYSLANDNILITASELKCSAGKGTINLKNAKYKNIVTDRPLTEENNESDDNNTSQIVQPENNIQDGNLGQTEQTVLPEVEDTVTEEIVETDPLDDIRLKILEIENVDVELNFEPDTKNYNINIPADIKELVIKAEPMNPDSTVTITDTELTYPVKNITKIVVEAQNGSKRTYKIYSMREITAKNSGTKAESLAVWQLALIIGGVVILLATIFIIILLILKSKKKNN